MVSSDEERVRKKKRKKLKRPKKNQNLNSYVSVDVDEEEALRVPEPPKPVVPYPEVEEINDLTSNGNSLPNVPMVHPRPKGIRASTSIVANTCRARTQNCCSYSRVGCVVFTLVFAFVIFLAGITYEDHHIRMEPPVVHDADAEQDTSKGNYDEHSTNGDGSNNNPITYSQRQMDLITEMRRLSGSVISEPRTPHHKAAHWMLWIDKSGIKADSPYLWQRYVMALFYYKMGDNNKFFFLLESTNECAWDRIQCDGNGYIHHLRFDHCDLRGPIPSKEIHALNKLQYLDLSGNKLTGEIPREFQVLTQIEKLFLDDNELEGEMPPQICSQLSSGTLKTLTSDCKESARKVSCSCCTNCPTMLPDLQTGLTSNQLEIQKKLKQLSGNDALSDENTPQFQAAQWILKEDTTIESANSSNLYQRYVLALLYYMMDGEQCFELKPEENECKWVSKPDDGVTWDRIDCDDDKNLTYLKLDHCNLTGLLPPELEVFSYISYLDLSENSLSGMVPPTLVNLHNLDHLYLEGNGLTGIVPDEICARKAEGNLLIFSMDCEHDNLKVHCQCCTNCPGVNGTDDNGDGVGHITAGLTARELAILNTLKEISGDAVVLDNTPQHRAAHWIMKQDDIAADSDRLIQRYVINLLHEMGDGTCFNRQSGVDVCHWLSTDTQGFSWSRILCNTGDAVLDLQLGGCNISGKIPVELQVFSTSIEFLDLSNNMFVGEIPVDLFQNFDNLRLLYFHNNLLGGVMPQEICDERSNDFLVKLTADCDLDDLNHVAHMVECSCCTNCVSASSPTISPDGNELSKETRSAQIKKAIQGLSPYSTANENSPQHLAMKWMMNEDKLHIVNLHAGSPRFAERYVMVVIYFSLGGQDLEDSLILSPEQSECSVPGVKCNEEGRIIELEFSDNQMEGTLPEEMHYLAEVTRIDLSNNIIHGRVPTKWGGLSKLEYLNLQSNDMIGYIPPALCHNGSVGRAYKVDCQKVTCSCCSDCVGSE